MNLQSTPQERPPVHFVMWSCRPGGIELSVNHYINHFSQTRKLHVYSLRPVENTLYDEHQISYHTGSDKNWQCYLRFFQYCKQHKNHVFHLLNVGPVILNLALLAGVKHPVYHIRGTVYWKGWRDKLYLKPAWMIAGALSKLSGKTSFVANSLHSKAIFVDKALPVNPKVIYNGFDIQRFLEKRTLRNSLRKIGFIGRFNPGKNVDLVIRLFEEVAGDFPELELHLAGDGPLRPALEEQAKGSFCRDRIFFHGFVKDAPAFYASIDLFLFLSEFESFGNVLAEALLTGLPVLTSTVPVFEEIFGGEKHFLLGDPGNFPDLVHRLRQAMADYPGLAAKAFKAGDFIRENFDIKNHLAEIQQVYDHH